MGRPSGPDWAAGACGASSRAVHTILRLDFSVKI